MRQVSAALIGGRAEPIELSDWWIGFFFFYYLENSNLVVNKAQYPQSFTDCQSGDPEMQGGRDFHRLCRADD